MYNCTISVVMSACNAEKTLKRAVDSVLFQSFPHWELLIVEHDSTDNTEELAKTLAKSDERIRVFSCGKGFSNARNLGIAESKGTWLTFIDSQDRLCPGALAYFAMKTREYQADMIMGTVTDGTKPFRHQPPDKLYSGPDAAAEALKCFMADPDNTLIAPAKLFSLEALRRKQIFFSEELTFAEDHDFCIRYLTHGTKIVHTFCPVYEHTPNMTRSDSVPAHLLEEEYMPSLRSIGMYIKEHAPKLEKAFYAYCSIQLLTIFNDYIAFPAEQKPRELIIKEIKTIANGVLFGAGIRRCSVKNMSKFRKTAVLLMKCRFWWGLYALLCAYRFMTVQRLKKVLTH